MTCHATPALHKGHGQGPDRDSVARGSPKGWMLERRQLMRQEGSSGMRDWYVKEEVRLRKKRIPARIFGKTVELKFAKQIVRTSLDCGRLVTEHCGGVGSLQNERRGCT
jgi:hypothetical protein